MREKPIRAFEDFRAKSVGGRSIRKRLATSSSIESAGIIASITAAEAAINSGEQQTLSRFQRDPDGKQDKRLIIIKIAANRRGVISRSNFSAESYNAVKFLQFCAHQQTIRCA
jgi:hypothetical protein